MPSSVPAASPRRLLQGALAYFALVFATGFVLGTLRVTVLLPRLGVRAAELLEMPVMVLACVLAARFCLRRFGPLPAPQRLALGLLALLLLAGAELGLVVAQGQALAAYVAGRDPVSGTAYLLALGVFALLPWWLGRRPARA